MSSFSRFQEINLSRGKANKKANSSFIVNGLPSILITGSNNEQVQAGVVNKQEKDMAYIYTHAGEDEVKLPIGSTWEAKGLHWLITEEIITIHDVDWHKYIAILCNVEISGQWGYFTSAEASYINTILREDVLLQSQQKPLLILANSTLKIGDKIMIKGRAWRIEEEDNLSTPGISYFSLSATTMSKEIIDTTGNKNLVIEKAPVIDADGDFTPQPNITYVNQLEVITLPTSYSYVLFSNKNVKIIKLTNSEVSFTLPFGVSETTVKVKDSYHNIKEFNYKVKGVE